MFQHDLIPIFLSVIVWMHCYQHESQMNSTFLSFFARSESIALHAVITFRLALP